MQKSPAPESREGTGDGLRVLAWARVAIGGLFLLRSTPLLGLFDPGLGADAHPLLGWPASGGEAAMGLGSSPEVVKLLCVVRTLALFGFAVGFRARVMGVVAAVSGTIVLFQTPFGFTSTQHLLLLGTLLLALADSSTVLAYRPEAARAPISSVWMVRAFVASVYVWAGISKLRPDWLDGRTLALFHDEHRLRGPLADLLLGTPSRSAIAGPAIALGELALGPLLLLPRTRPFALALAIGLHLGIEWMARPDVIGWAMLCLLLVFVRVAPQEVRSAAQRMHLADAAGQTTSP